MLLVAVLFAVVALAVGAPAARGGGGSGPSPPFVNKGTVHVGVGEVAYIESPNYPNNYPTWQVTGWTLTAPRGHVLVINAEAFEVEGTTTPWYNDWLGFWELSAYTASYGRDGVTGPQNLRTQTNSVFVKFESDRSVTFSGFRLRIETAPQ
ncbi:hypothetical protein BV898_15870 [Hypsibius exemplaris]|uniref:CUB domain-containing protein n=1 Tax=Hypsibius exemplaris TaxID=2072580 RepID=A0A9X6NCG3_HYPEX|nr:hypothetical protein BV898_15870 [Hypsibius exemplaris]